MSKQVVETEKMLNLKQVCEEIARSRGITLTQFDPLTLKVNSDLDSCLKKECSYLKEVRSHLEKKYEQPIFENGFSMKGTNRKVLLAYIFLQTPPYTWGTYEKIIAEDSQRGVDISLNKISIKDKRQEEAVEALRNASYAPYSWCNSLHLVSSFRMPHDNSPDDRKFYDGVKFTLDMLLEK